MTQTEENKIINFFKDDAIGKAFNTIQDLGLEVMNEKEINHFLRLTNIDNEKCEGEDGMLVNGNYFDWKEFTWNRKEMLKAFLTYFDEISLNCADKVVKNICKYIDNTKRA